MKLTRRRFRIHPAWWTAVLFSIIVAFVWLCSATFAGSLASNVPVTVTAQRSGLVMETGAKVKFRGVQVGRVASIEGGNGVRLQLLLFSDQVKYIPANAEAQIRATTIFGAKYVDLVSPENPSRQHISAGAVLRSQNVTTEVNTVFENLVNVLNHIDPPKLNAFLTAFADAVRGRGERIGEGITAGNHLLAAINPRMPRLQQDWRSLTAASNAYGAAAHDLVTTLNAFSTTSATLTHQASDLDVLLLNVIGVSQAGIELLAPNKDTLIRAVNILPPTTDLLEKYSPEYTCLLVGAKSWLDNSAYEAIGGNGRSLVIDSAFMFGSDPYRYPDNLPKVAAKGGPGGKPGCGSLPDVAANYPVRQLVTDTGWGTGLDIRPNPGIGFPGWVNFFPVTRANPEPPSIRNLGPPAPGPPPPYLGGPPYGAAQYGPDGTPLYPPPPGIPTPAP